MPFLRVYTASQTRHAARWRDLAATSPVIQVTSRWTKQVHLDTLDILDHETIDKDFALHCWVEDKEDILTSDVVMVYAEEGDRLRGALVEAGIAMCAGIPIALVGPKDHPDWGSWQYAPEVVKFQELFEFTRWCEVELKNRFVEHRLRRKFPRA